MESKSHLEPAYKETPLEEKSIRILLVEDNPGDVVIIDELLRSSGIDYSLRHSATLKETLMVCMEETFDIILLDLGLSDSVGVETLKKMLVFNTSAPVVVMTGLDDEDVALESLRQGAQDYLVKNRLNSDNIVRGIKYGIERKKIQDLLKRNALRFSLLSTVTSAINECEDIPSICNVASDNISRLLNNAGVACIRIDSPGNIFSTGIGHYDSWFKEIDTVAGIDLNKSVIDTGSQNEFLKTFFQDGKLHKIKERLTRTRDPGQTDNSDKTKYRIDGPALYAMGFTRNEIIYGGVLIITPEFIDDEEVNIIETIGNQVSLSLQRKAIEKDLKVSEERYRKLSKDLELKVRERTHDLESSNYLLNQELIDRHLAEEALKKSEMTLKDLNATKDKFFSIIAHDLKNPFTCLLGSTEVLNEKLDNMDTEKIRNLVQIINDSARSGYSVLQNLLVWSKSQTGMISINPEPVNLKDIIDKCISTLKAYYPRKEIKIVSETKGEMKVVADRNMIITVLNNIVDNSYKFTPSYGTIKIKAENKRGEIEFSVSDTGIGIPAENLRDLFRIDKKFTRPGTNKEQGTGLGLKICKEFIDMQGGKLEVKSTVNKGSMFTFTIPVSRS